MCSREDIRLEDVKRFCEWIQIGDAVHIELKNGKVFDCIVEGIAKGCIIAQIDLITSTIHWEDIRKILK